MALPAIQPPRAIGQRRRIVQPGGLAAGVTVSRASGESYLDATGTLQVAGNNLPAWACDPAQVRRNLLPSSEELGSATTVVRATQEGNAGTAPTGAPTADRLVEQTDTGQNRSANKNALATLDVGQRVVFSVYAKAAERGHINMRFSNGATLGITGSVVFNLATGAATRSGVTVDAWGTTDAGNGWWRCWISGVLTGAAAPGCQVFPHSGSSITYDGIAGSGVLLWGWMCEVGSASGPTAYIPTTGSVVGTAYGGAQRLQVYEARTNIALKSIPGVAGWNTNLTPTVTLNAGTAPDGTTTATQLAVAAASSGWFHGSSLTVVSGAAQVQSIYVKAVSGTGTLKIGCDSNPTTGWVRYDPSTGTIVSAAASVTASAVVDVGGGWRRVWWTYLATSTTNSFTIYGWDATAVTALLWGADHQAGTFPTPHIPTTGTAATRAADAVTVPAAALFPVAGEGTVLVKAMLPATVPTGAFPRIVDLSDGTTNNRISLFGINPSGTPVIRVETAVSGAAATADPVSMPAAGTLFRVGLTWGAGRIAVSLNGAAAVAYVRTLPAGLTRLDIGNRYDAIRALNGELETVQTLPYAASDAELRALVSAL